MGNRIVLLSPNLYGNYSICVSELLFRNGIVVDAIFVRRLTSVRRLLVELKTMRFRELAKKVVRKLVFRRLAHAGAVYDTLASLKQRERIEFSNLKAFAKARGSRVLFCDDLNEPWVADEVRRLAPAAVVFTGGGLVRRPLLEASSWKIVNCHPGVLPRYRGMDALEWAIFENHPHDVGVTTHLMDVGVDTGPILRVRRTALVPTDRSFDDVRARLEPVMCMTMTESVVDFVRGVIVPVPQDRSAGRQYFTMHPTIRAVAAARLSATRRAGDPSPHA